MEETPEAKTVAVKGVAEAEAVGQEVPLQEAGDSRTSGEGLSRCSRDEDVHSSFEFEILYKWNFTSFLTLMPFFCPKLTNDL